MSRPLLHDAASASLLSEEWEPPPEEGLKQGCCWRVDMFPARNGLIKD